MKPRGVHNPDYHELPNTLRDCRYCVSSSWSAHCLQI